MSALSDFANQAEQLLLQKADQIKINLPIPGKEVTLTGSADYDNGNFSIGVKSPDVVVADILSFLGISDELNTYNVDAVAEIQSIKVLAIDVNLMVSPFSVVSFSLQAGLPPTHILSAPVDSITLTMGVISPVSKPSLYVFLEGIVACDTADLKVALSFPGTAFSVGLQDGDSVAFAAFYKDYFGSLPALPDKFPAVKITAATASGNLREGTLTFNLSADASWAIPCCTSPLALTFKSIDLEYNSKQSPSVSGSISISASFAGAVLTGNFSLSGSFSLAAAYPEINLRTLFKALLPAIPGIEVIPDVTVRDVCIGIAENRGDFKFNIGASVEGFGVLMATYHSANTALAVGFALPDSWKLSDIPGMPQAFDGISFNQSVLILSTGEFASAADALPAYPDFKTPAFPPTKLQPAGPGVSITKGITLYTTIDLSSGVLSRLSKLLSNTGTTLQLSAQISVNPMNVLFRGTMAGSVSLSGKNSGGITLSNPQLVLGLQNNVVLVGVEGGLTVKTDDEDLLFSGRILFEENEALFAGTLASWNNAFGVKGLNAADLSLDVGFSYEGLPAIGIAGIFAIKTFNGAFAIQFDSGNPGDSMFAGSMSSITASDILELFAAGATVPDFLSPIVKNITVGGVRTFTIPASFAAQLNTRQPTIDLLNALNKSEGDFSSDTTKTIIQKTSVPDAWFITNLSKLKSYQLSLSGSDITVSEELQVYLAPQDTTIGTLPPFKQGYYFDGKLTAYNASAAVNVELDPSKGMYLDVTMTAITIGSVLKIAGYDGNSGPILSLATYNYPGGRLSGPYFLLSGQGTLEHVFTDKVDIKASASGFAFHVSTKIFSVVTATIDATVGSLQSLEKADFTLAVTIQGDQFGTAVSKAANNLKTAADGVDSGFTSWYRKMEDAKKTVSSLQSSIDANNRKIKELKSKESWKHPLDTARYETEIKLLQGENISLESSITISKGIITSAAYALKGFDIALCAGLNELSDWLAKNPLDKLIQLNKASFSTSMSQASGANFTLALDMSFQGKSLPGIQLAINFHKFDSFADALTGRLKEYLKTKK
jgi:hypothetical protein